MKKLSCQLLGIVTLVLVLSLFSCQDKGTQTSSKLTVLYGHPQDTAAFEKYYKEKHLPLASKIAGVTRLELTKFTAAPDGSKPSYYRMAELNFANDNDLKKAMDSPEGKTAVADLRSFATGGVTVIVGTVGK
ncbi:MAG: Ethyl tert-butyl ether degradation EthD [Chitinophagaceae bacterium]|nr:Ethyl tert-butyl ether degradation EthD [Chitinophagaceae bacterium]